MTPQEQQLSDMGYSLARRLLDGDAVWKHAVTGDVVRVSAKPPLDADVDAVLRDAGMQLRSAVYTADTAEARLEGRGLVAHLTATEGDDVVVRFRRAP